MARIIYILLLIGWLLVSVQNLSAVNPTIDSLLSIVQSTSKKSSTETEAKVLHELGVAYYELEQHTESEKYFKKSLYLAREHWLKELSMENLYYLGVTSFWLSDYRQSVVYLQQSLDVFPEVLTPEDSTFIIDQMGEAYFYLGDLDIAFDYRLQLLSLSHQYKDSTFLAITLCALAEIEKEQKDFESALRYVEESIQVCKQIGDDYYLDYGYNLLGDIYHETGDYEKALEFKLQSCELSDSTMIHYLSAHCDHNLAETYAKMGDYERAIYLFSKALEKREATNQREEAAQSQACLGVLWALEGKCEKGMALLTESLGNAQELNLNPLYLDVYEKLFVTAKECGQYERAVKYQEKYLHYRDIMFDRSTHVQIANLTAEKELDILELEVLQKDKRLSKLYIGLLGIGSAFLLLASVFTFWLYKKQRNDNKLQAERSASIAAHNIELTSTNEKLESVNAELEQFAYVISHDLKAPLRTMGSYSSLLNRRYKNQLDEDGQNFLRYITDDAKHMHTLLENILDYSKISKSEVPFDKVDMNEVMDRVEHVLASGITEKNANIEYDQLPTINGNITQLTQVFQNLIDNALKFIPADRQPHITISAMEQSAHFRFCIQDNGIGIPADLQPKIFAPFKRLHNRDKYKGTGIGLAICQKVVERHGGKIWVESDGVSGTGFCFTLRK